MLRIGVFSDPHANLPALKAALAYLEGAGCREFLCCGDLVGIGPWPQEVAALLQSRGDIHCLAGNHDRYFDRCLAPPYPPRMEEGEAAHHRWVHGALSPTTQKWLRERPLSLTLRREEVRISALHYPLDAAGEFAPPRPAPTAGDCRALFGHLPGQVVLCGHDHAGFAVADGARLFLNPGSLGCPHGLGGIARCGVLTLDRGRWQWQAAAPTYDLHLVRAAFARRRVPEGPALLRAFYGPAHPPF